MSSVKSQMAIMPEGETLDARPNKLVPPSSQKVTSVAQNSEASSPASAKQPAFIGTGGMTLAVNGAENLPLPIVPSIVSTRGVHNNTPMVKPVGNHTSNWVKALFSKVGTTVAASLVMVVGTSAVLLSKGDETSADKVHSVWERADHVSSHKRSSSTQSGSLLNSPRPNGAQAPLFDLTPRRVKVEEFNVSGEVTGSIGSSSSGNSLLGKTFHTDDVAIPRPRPSVSHEITPDIDQTG